MVGIFLEVIAYKTKKLKLIWICLMQQKLENWGQVQDRGDLKYELFSPGFKDGIQQGINSGLIYHQICLLFFIIIFNVSCSKCSFKKDTKVSDCLNYGIPLEPASLDPAATGDYINWQIAFNIFETLVSYDWESGTFLPILATKWEQSSDNLTWIFNLRKKVYFHDGTLFNAEDVKASFDRLINEHSPYYQKHLLAIYRDLVADVIDEVVVTDDSSVQFKLKSPCSCFLDNLASPYFSLIVSASALKKSSDNISSVPIGTGPLRFKGWEKNRQIILEKNDLYWGKAARIKEINYKIVPVLQDRIDLLEKLELDIITGLSAASSNNWYYNDKIILITPRIAGTVFLGFNCQRPPFDNKVLRKAILTALDLKTAVSAINRGFADMAQNALPPIIADYDSSIKQAGFHLENARNLIKSVKLPPNKVYKLGYFIETDSLRADPFAQYIKDQLQKIGIPIQIVPYCNWDLYYQEVILQHQVELLYDGWIAYTRDASTFLKIMFYSSSAYNFFNYQNKEVDHLLDLARSTFDDGKRRKLCSLAHEIIIDDTPAVFISHPSMGYAISKRVKNFKPNMLMVVKLDQIELSSGEND